MKKQHIKLTTPDREQLEEMLKKGSLKARIYKRIHSLLELDKGHTYVSVSKVARLSMLSVRNLAHKYNEQGLECLYDQPRAGRPIKISTDLEDKIILLACEQAPKGYSQWSIRLLSDKVVELGYCESISHTQVHQILKKRELSLT